MSEFYKHNPMKKDEADAYMKKEMMKVKGWLQLYSIFAKPDTKCKKCKSKNIKSRTVNKVI